jgi:hypothetical protein
MTFHPVKRCYVRDPQERVVRFIIWYVVGWALLVAFGEWLIGRRG